MRLLTYDTDGNLNVTRDFPENEVEPYAILSHTWDEEEKEVTFKEIGSSTGQQKSGYEKIQLCGKQARQDGCQYFWVDTCCIDKANHSELSKAIISMYRWYQQAQVCYVHLADVSSRPASSLRDWQSSFRQSRWFTRGWTLQELLAPRIVVFFSKEWDRLGTKDELKELLHNITNIPIPALEGQPLTQFPIIERMRWTRGRQTKEKEDQAYSLLGLFGVYMPLIYGEGDNAFRRLQKKLDIQLRDRTVEPIRDYSFQQPVGLCLGQAPSIERKYFVGRSCELDEMAKILLSRNDIDYQRRLILGGIGGIGKTQLALTYAQQYSQHYESVFWLNATSEATLLLSFKTIAKRIFPPQNYHAINTKQLLNHVLSWLSHPRNTRWMLIFDNYDAPQLYDIRSFYPDTAHGVIIITTRRPDLVAGKQIYVKSLKNLDEGLQILQTRSERGDLENNLGASRLAERLAGLPLALATAGVFLRKSVWTFQQYLDAYEKQWKTSARKPFTLLEYQDRTLYTTWNISFDRLLKEAPDAAQLLKLLAYFDHQAIWYDLLYAGTDKNLPGWLFNIISNPIDFESTIQVLVDYCFIEPQVTTQTYSMHMCVHDWTSNQTLEPWSYWYAFHCIASSIDGEEWESLGNVRYAKFTPHAIRLVNARFTNIRNDIAETDVRAAESIAALLRGQVQLSSACLFLGASLVAREKALGVEHLSTLATIADLGLLYIDQGKLVQAEQMFDRALTGFEKILGAEHIVTLHTISSLGNLYANQGKLVEAEQVYTRALAGKEKALGAEHLSTLETVLNLGALYIYQDKLVEAEQMSIRALAGFEKVLGVEYILTLTAANNLGLLYFNQGKLEEAEQMYLRALAGFEKVLGVEHISTLNTVDNLGLLYCNQGKLAEAEQMHLRALAGREKALGMEHITTLKTVLHLGNLFLNQEKLVEAEQIYIRALTGLEKKLGVKHILTLTAVNNLGVLYFDQGKLEEAEQMYTRALAGRERALGASHTSTLETVLNLGNVYLDQGKLVKAEQMYTRALSMVDKALGAGHTSTLTAVNNLGVLYFNQDKLEEAEQMYARALAGREKALGASHILTLETVDNLGLLYRNQGKLAKAEQIHLRALAGFEKALGAEHTSTLETVDNLGDLYFDQGELAEAERLYFRALAGKEKALGAEHVSTLDTVYNLGNLYFDQGKLAEAEQMYIRVITGREKVLGAEHMLTLGTVHNLGLLYSDQGKLVESEQLLKRVAAGRHEALGSCHDDTKKVIDDLENLRLAIAKQDESRQLPQDSRKRDRFKRLLGI